MNGLKKILGILWIAIAMIVGYFGITVLGIPKIVSGKQEDLVFGIIILFVLMPIISGGMAIFGYYALKGEYNFKGVITDFNSEGTVGDAYEDFKDAIPLDTLYHKYTTQRPLKFYSSFQYSFEEDRSEECNCTVDEDSWYRSALGVQLFAMSTPREPMLALTGYYRRRILEGLQMKATYTVDSYSAKNIGLGLTAKIGVVNFYAMADNLLSYKDISKANSLTFQIGFNIISGGSNK